METKELIDFWGIIFRIAKERQEAGEQATYKSVIMDALGLNNARFKGIPDLVGVDIDEDLVYEWLRHSMVSKTERFAADLYHITMPGEVWRVVPGFSRYQVSTLGRVWSTYHGKLMTPQLHRGNGSYHVMLLKNDEGAFKRMYVHRLVAQTFLSNPKGCNQVDHIDENKQNNQIDNLRWVDGKENLEFYMRNHGYWYNPDSWSPGKPRKTYPCPKDTREEQWKNVVNYPDYFVSSLGRVWSIYVGQKNVYNGATSMLAGGQTHNVSVRSAVAAAFLPPKEEGQVLRHKNGDGSDNRACNLYWAWPYKPKSHKRGRPKRDPGALLISPTPTRKTTRPVELLQ